MRLCVALCALLAATPALAGEVPGTFSGGVTAGNDYVFRGISQTDHGPAVQGSIGYALPTGVAGSSIYLGVWGSNLQFNDAGGKNHGASLETDLSAGVKGPINETVSYDVGAIYYAYPGAPDDHHYNYWEAAPNLTWAINEALSLNGGVNVSPNFFGNSGLAYYPNVGATYKLPVPESWLPVSVFGSTGHQFIEDEKKFGAPDYQDWKFGVSTTLTKGVTLSAAYTDTDLSKSECYGGTNLCGPTALVSLGVAF